MVEVAVSDPAAQHRSLEAERTDATLQFQRRFLRHHNRQSGQCLEAVRPSGGGLGHGIVGAARQIDASSPKVM